MGEHFGEEHQQRNVADPADVLQLLQENQRQISEQLESWMQRQEELVQAVARFSPVAARADLPAAAPALVGSLGSRQSAQSAQSATTVGSARLSEQGRQKALMNSYRERSRFRDAAMQDREREIELLASDRASRSSAISIASRAAVGNIVRSPGFEASVALLVITNCLLIGLDVHLQSVSDPGYSSIVIEILHTVYAALFALELFCRLYAEGPRFHRGTNRYWNFFDTFLVLFSTLDFVQLAAALRAKETGPDRIADGNALSNFSNAGAIRIIRMTRVVRVMRINRLLRFIVPLRLLVLSILATLWHLFWAMLLLSLLVFAYAILIMQALNEHRLDHHGMELTGDAAKNMAALEAVREHWSDLPRAMVTLFRSITGGLNWGEVVDPLSFVRLDLPWVFLTFVILSVFAVLNVMTGVFCHEAIENAQRQQDVKVRSVVRSNQDNMTSIRQIFNSLDADNSGGVSYRELTKHCKDPSVAMFLASLDLEPSDLWLLFNIMDEDGSECIDQAEFVKGCLRLKGPAKAWDLAALAFEHKRSSEMMVNFMTYVESRMQYLVGGIDSLALDEINPEGGHNYKGSYSTLSSWMETAATPRD